MKGTQSFVIVVPVGDVFIARYTYPILLDWSLCNFHLESFFLFLKANKVKRWSYLINSWRKTHKVKNQLMRSCISPPNNSYPIKIVRIGNKTLVVNFQFRRLFWFILLQDKGNMTGVIEYAFGIFRIYFIYFLHTYNSNIIRFVQRLFLLK